jgi:5-(carboxyamino)imidazole ribonucleotide mutase
MPDQSPPLSSGSARRVSAAPVAVVMGSDSDFSVMRAAAEALAALGVGCDVAVVSAHRTPLEMVEFARTARVRGVRVIVAGAGGAAHLPGMIAALTELPVIGVPVPLPPLDGHDSLLSIVQMPRGVPVATVAVGNAWNAGLLAAQILAAGGRESDEALLDRLAAYKEGLRQTVLAKTLPSLEGPESLNESETTRSGRRVGRYCVRRRGAGIVWRRERCRFERSALCFPPSASSG